MKQLDSELSFSVDLYYSDELNDLTQKIINEIKFDDKLLCDKLLCDKLSHTNVNDDYFDYLKLSINSNMMGITNNSLIFKSNSKYNFNPLTDSNIESNVESNIESNIESDIESNIESNI